MDAKYFIPYVTGLIEKIRPSGLPEESKLAEPNIAHAVKEHFLKEHFLQMGCSIDKDQVRWGIEFCIKLPAEKNTRQYYKFFKALEPVGYIKFLEYLSAGVCPTRLSIKTADFKTVTLQKGKSFINSSGTKVKVKDNAGKKLEEVVPQLINLYYR